MPTTYLSTVLTFCIFSIYQSGHCQIPLNELEVGHIYNVKVGQNRTHSYKIDEKSDSTLVLSTLNNHRKVEVPFRLISKIRNAYLRKPNIGLSIISILDVAPWESGYFMQDKVVFFEKLTFRYPIKYHFDVGGAFIYSNQDFAEGDIFNQEYVNHFVMGFEIGGGMYKQIFRKINLGLRAGFRYTNSEIMTAWLSDTPLITENYKTKFYGAYSRIIVEYSLSSRIRLLLSSNAIHGKIKRTDRNRNSTIDFNSSQFKPLGSLNISYFFD